MDQKNNRVVSVACLLYRAGQRLQLGLKFWKREIGRETDQELEDIVNSIATGCVEAKPLLQAAELQHADGSGWDPGLLVRLSQIGGDLGTSVIDPWKKCKARSKARKTLVAQWKATNPTTSIQARLAAWFHDLHDAWLAAARSHCRECLPPPVPGDIPSFFIASSSEGAPVAKAFIKAVKAIRPLWKLDFWKDPKVFQPGKSTLEDLERIIGRSDFGIYILTPDDKLTIRNKRTVTARGNVIFELGIGIGLHCRERSFIVHDKVYTMSDLSGITTLGYSVKNGSKKPNTKECQRVAEEIVEAVRKETDESRSRWTPAN